MTGDFAFDGAKSFDENFELFLESVKIIDEELAIILQANASKLAQIVCDGERNSNARTEFNAAIAQALDELAVRSSSEDS